MQRATGNMTLSEIYTQGVFFQLPMHPDRGPFRAVPRQFSLRYVRIPAEKYFAQRENSSLPVTFSVFRYTLAMLIMTYCVQNRQFVSRYRKRGFQILFLLLAVTDLSEWLAASLIGADETLRGTHIAAKFLELLLTPVVLNAVL